MEKWFFIAAAFLFVSMFAPLVADSYSKMICKQSAFEHNYTPEQIVKICGRQ